MKRMKRLYNITLILLLLLFASAGASAQIRGVITDSLTHEPLMYITVQYEGKGVGASPMPTENTRWRRVKGGMN